MSEYSKASSLNDDVVALVKKYGEKELSISEADIGNISLVWYSPKTSPEWVSKVVKNAAHCVALGVPPLSIILVKTAFDDIPRSMVRAHLFHSLKRINFNESDGTYKLVNPDINDFSDLLLKVGLFYENVDSMFADEILHEAPSAV